MPCSKLIKARFSVQWRQVVYTKTPAASKNVLRPQDSNMIANFIARSTTFSQARPKHHITPSRAGPKHHITPSVKEAQNATKGPRPVALSAKVRPSSVLLARPQMPEGSAVATACQVVLVGKTATRRRMPRGCGRCLELGLPGNTLEAACNEAQNNYHMCAKQLSYVNAQ